MVHRPSFQFYPADWRKDAGLRSCSPSARSDWIDLLCLAHECEPYGTLQIKGRPMTVLQLARAIGITERSLQQHLNELEAANVFSRDAAGCIYSRRMVRDERVRMARAAGGIEGKDHGSKGAAHGVKGGRPPITPLTPPVEGGLEKPPLKPPPSSSSSFASKNLRPKPTSANPVGFADFWAAYPNKKDKKDASKAWLKLAPDQELIDRIMAAIIVAKRSDEWTSEGGTYIPHPTTWLHGERWEDELRAANTGKGADDWWKSEAATLAKQQELGLSSRAGESWRDLRERIRQRLNETQP